MFKNKKDGNRKTRICGVNGSIVILLASILSCSVYTQDHLKMKLKEEFRFNQAQFQRSKGLFREQRPVIESIFDQLPVRSRSLLPLCQSLVPVSSLQL